MSPDKSLECVILKEYFIYDIQWRLVKVLFYGNQNKDMGAINYLSIIRPQGF